MFRGKTGLAQIKEKYILKLFGSDSINSRLIILRVLGEQFGSLSSSFNLICITQLHHLM